MKYAIEDVDCNVRVVTEATSPEAALKRFLKENKGSELLDFLGKYYSLVTEQDSSLWEEEIEVKMSGEGYQLITARVLVKMIVPAIKHQLVSCELMEVDASYPEEYDPEGWEDGDFDGKGFCMKVCDD